MIKLDVCVREANRTKTTYQLYKEFYCCLDLAQFNSSLNFKIAFTLGNQARVALPAARENEYLYVLDQCFNVGLWGKEDIMQLS